MKVEGWKVEEGGILLPLPLSPFSPFSFLSGSPDMLKVQGLTAH